MNGCWILLLAATLSAGNAEFDQSAREGAATIAFSRIQATLTEQGPATGLLERAMLAESAAFRSRAEAKERCRELYRAAVDEEFARHVSAVKERLSLGDEFRPETRPQVNARLFEQTFETERRQACERQVKTIAGAVKPTEAEIESTDEATLRQTMTAHVAAQQKDAIFEENLAYISTAIVDPVLASAKKEMRRQRDYLMRTKCESFAPSALAEEMVANLRKNIAERNAKKGSPIETWGLFSQTVEKALPAAVERRTIDHVVKNVDEVPVAIEAETILKAMAKDPSAHQKAEESEKVFRGIFAAHVTDGARTRAAQDAPAQERAEFETYVRAHAAAPELVRAVESRIRRELLPQWKKARRLAAANEARRIWPTLADRTWYPEAELADAVAARSDFAAVTKAWRSVPQLDSLVRAPAGQPLLEETDATADAAVAAAFELARNAVAAQKAIVGDVTASVLNEAKSRQASFWRRTPDFKTIVELLTDAVEDNWSAQRLKTLWGDGERPVNADEQHTALFPSVKRQIELVARQILEEMEKPEPEQKPEPQPEDPLCAYSIVVERAGDAITVRLEQGPTTVIERNAKANLLDFRGAIREVSERLGTDILKLK